MAITEDEYFMEIARTVAKKSTCMRRQVGALLVKDGHIIATGYNGAPKGVLHCEDIGCVREKFNIPSGKNHELCRGVHAEQNTLVQSALHTCNPKGAKLYCTTFPCSSCMKLLINAQVSEIIFEQEYNDALSELLAQDIGLKVRQFGGKLSAIHIN